MKFDDMPVAEARASDGLAMVRSIARLKELGFDVRRPSGNPHQIKITPDLSFYPTTGKIVFDARPALKERGLAALLAFLGR